MHSYSLHVNRLADMRAIRQIADFGMPDECDECGAPCHGEICDECADEPHECEACEGRGRLLIYPADPWGKPVWGECFDCGGVGSL